jgi:integrase
MAGRAASNLRDRAHVLVSLAAAIVSGMRSLLETERLQSSPGGVVRRGAVAVWTVEQLTEFLSFVRDDRLFALWWLIALRGLRRVEVAGLRWIDLDTERRELTIACQLIHTDHAGQRPAVAVWTTEYLTEFLEYVREDALYPLWWLAALRGLRRGELVGLRWADISLETAEITVP